MTEVAAQPNYTLNKNKLNNKVKTVCIYCKSITRIRNFTVTCDEYFEEDK